MFWTGACRVRWTRVCSCDLFCQTSLHKLGKREVSPSCASCDGSPWPWKGNIVTITYRDQFLRDTSFSGSLVMRNASWRKQRGRDRGRSVV